MKKWLKALLMCTPLLAIPAVLAPTLTSCGSTQQETKPSKPTIPFGQELMNKCYLAFTTGFKENPNNPTNPAVWPFPQDKTNFTIELSKVYNESRQEAYGRVGWIYPIEDHNLVRVSYTFNGDPINNIQYGGIEITQTGTYCCTVSTLDNQFSKSVYLYVK